MNSVGNQFQMQAGKSLTEHFLTRTKRYKARTIKLMASKLVTTKEVPFLIRASG